jgi:hypothetical protein
MIVKVGLSFDELISMSVGKSVEEKEERKGKG